MNIKSILLSSVVGLTSILGGVSEAQAGVQCFNGRGYRMCFEQVAQNGQFNTWNVGVRNAHTDEIMKVTCNGKYVSDWNSQGGFNQSEAEYLARYFCSL